MSGRRESLNDSRCGDPSGHDHAVRALEPLTGDMEPAAPAALAPALPPTPATLVPALPPAPPAVPTLEPPTPPAPPTRPPAVPAAEPAAPPLPPLITGAGGSARGVAPEPSSPAPQAAAQSISTSADPRVPFQDPPPMQLERLAAVQPGRTRWPSATAPCRGRTSRALRTRLRSRASGCGGAP
jgi:hypothetical protein